MLAAIVVAGLSVNGSAAKAEGFPVKAVAPPATDWTGFYAGALAGVVYGSADGDYSGVPPPPPPPPVIYYPFGINPHGFLFGGLAGYNRQYGRWVYGIEGDFSWIVNAEDRAYDPAGSGRYDQIELFWTAHARARVGFLFDRLMVFVAGGAAFTHTRHWHYALDALYNDSRTLVGYSLGAGVEAALSARWRARFEYLYDDFYKQYYNWTSTRYSSADLALHTFRVAIIYRFNQPDGR